MRLLIASGILIFFMTVTGCTPQAALTPQAAFHDLREAFRSSDAEALERQLSAGSVKKVRRMASLFAAMNDTQRAAIAAKTGVREDKLRRLSVREWCAVALAMDSGLRQAASASMVGIDRKGDRAIVRLDNGMTVTFVKEGPYWKLDVGDL